MDGSRNYHLKSRNGCGQCKRRRVRCSLQAPICAHCKRRGETCDYQFLNAEDSSKTAGEALTFAGPICSRPQGEPGPGVSHTSYGHPLDTKAGIMICLYLEDWADFQQRLAHDTQRHPFLQEILSSVSVLKNGRAQGYPGLVDLKEANPDINACQHQVAASSSFRDSVRLINNENWLAVLAFAVSTLVVHFAQGRRPVTEQRVDTFLESMLLMRNSAQIGRQLRPWLLHSGLIARVHKGLSSDVPAWDHLAEQALLNLHTVNRIHNSSAAVFYDICEDSINKLQIWLHSISGQPRIWLHFVWWPGEVSDEYFEILSMKNPMALVIFLHWCAVMTKAPVRWFVQGWAQNLAHSALEHLRPTWFNMISWARGQLEI